MLISQSGFQIVRPKSPEIQPFWANLTASLTTTKIYVGQIVRRIYSASEDGVITFGVASGNGDTSHKYIPLGIVVGTNNHPSVATYDTTYMTEYITNPASATPTQANLATQSRVLVEGPYGKGSKVSMVKIAPITPTTIIRGRIFNAAWGTAPTVLTATTAMTDGAITAITTNAREFTPVAGTCSIYCRTGANAGAYRTTYDTTTTAPSTLTPFEKNGAIGDTFVGCGLPTFGLGLMQLDALAMFVNNATSGGTTNWYYVNVYKLDLAEAGNEYVEFSFSTIHFDPYRQ